MTKEQQAAKELAAAAELRLKNLRLQTQKDCKVCSGPCSLNRASVLFLAIRIWKRGCSSWTKRDWKWNRCRHPRRLIKKYTKPRNFL